MNYRDASQKADDKIHSFFDRRCYTIGLTAALAAWLFAAWLIFS